MDILGRLLGKRGRGQAAPSGTASQPPRADVLNSPEIDPDVIRGARLDRAANAELDADGDDVLRVYSAARIDSGDVHPGTGPRWDPYDAQQSRRERLRAARAARARSESDVAYDRWSARLDKPPALSYYQRLGVRHDASLAQIEHAFRRYVASVHPDKFFDDPKARTEAEGKLRQLNAIMATLRDPAKRAAYDASI
jgi:DnaJ-domain-containing protein 1